MNNTNDNLREEFRALINANVYVEGFCEECSEYVDICGASDAAQDILNYIQAHIELFFNQPNDFGSFLKNSLQESISIPTIVNTNKQNQTLEWTTIPTPVRSLVEHVGIIHTWTTTESII